MSNIVLSENKESVKTLGLSCNPIHDSFNISIPDEQISCKNTKREILSTIAKIFDPLGLVGAVIMSAKLIMQELWKEKLEWDTPIYDHILTTWKTFKNELHNFQDLSVPRYISLTNVSSIQIHGFSDASLKGYGCCVYLSVEDEQGKIQTNLLCLKSRVAPLKIVSLPRLELCVTTIQISTKSH